MKEKEHLEILSYENELKKMEENSKMQSSVLIQDYKTQLETNQAEVSSNDTISEKLGNKLDWNNVLKWIESDPSIAKDKMSSGQQVMLETISKKIQLENL